MESTHHWEVLQQLEMSLCGGWPFHCQLDRTWNYLEDTRLVVRWSHIQEGFPRKEEPHGMWVVLSAALASWTE